MTVRTYIDVIQFFDSFRRHRFYFRAAIGAINAYTELCEKRHRKELPEVEELPEPQDEKIKKSNTDDAVRDHYIAKTEKELVNSKAPLKEAKKFLDFLVGENPDRIEAHIAALLVYICEGNADAAMKSLKAASAIDAEYPQLLLQKARYLHSFPEAAQREAAFFETTDTAVFTTTIIDRGLRAQSTPLLLAATQSYIYQSNTDAALGVAKNFTVLPSQLQESLDADVLLRQLGDESLISGYAEMASERFPLATRWKPEPSVESCS